MLPDFPTGGILDPTGYDGGRGQVKLRARDSAAFDTRLHLEIGVGFHAAGRADGGQPAREVKPRK